jgi:hypothetical protein
MPFEAERDHTGHRIDSLTTCAIYQKSLRVACRSCLHFSILPAVSVWWLFEQRGWDDGLNQACNRFYCSSCWSRKKERVRDPYLKTSNEKPTADPFPWPDERIWKRMVRRFKT